MGAPTVTLDNLSSYMKYRLTTMKAQVTVNCYQGAGLGRRETGRTHESAPIPKCQRESVRPTDHPQSIILSAREHGLMQWDARAPSLTGVTQHKG